LAKTMGGRAAEILIYGKDKVTNGASGDIQQATSIARAMVEQWGMSEALGPVLYAGRQEGLSGETARIVDDEVRRIVDESHAQAAAMLKEHEDVLHKTAEALMKYETLDAAQVAELMDRKEPTPPPGWGEDSSNTPPSSGAGVVSEDKPKSNVTPIGGPADQQS
jgi:cell division protease FtsH